MRTPFAVAIGLALSGCSDGGGVNTEPVAVASGTPTPAATPLSEEDAILAAYRAFFAAQTPTSEAPASERRAMLGPLATDPALSRALRGMFAADKLGQVGYGEERLSPRVSKVEGDEATVTDCQDTSGAGRKERDSGKVVSRGTPEVDARTTLRRGDDGAWRVATVDYKDDQC